MRYVGQYPAEARDGPLAHDMDLTVPKQDGQEVWPTPVVWSTEAGERHAYELMAVEVGPELALFPVYVFLRTLGVEESEPETAWVVPSRYLM
jgi:hypothetical protein